jgi:hypothetical protein
MTEDEVRDLIAPVAQPDRGAAELALRDLVHLGHGVHRRRVLHRWNRPWRRGPDSGGGLEREEVGARAHPQHERAGELAVRCVVHLGYGVRRRRGLHQQPLLQGPLHRRQRGAGRGHLIDARRGKRSTRPRQQAGGCRRAALVEQMLPGSHCSEPSEGGVALGERLRSPVVRTSSRVVTPAARAHGSPPAAHLLGSRNCA